MTEQLVPLHFESNWMNSKLPAVLVGDIAAAIISATAISPILTAIDIAVVENAASSKHPLLPTLRTHILGSFRHPRLFFTGKPFWYICTLYAATYTTANSIESLGNALTSKADKLLVNSITFLATCVVNVPLGVWKDIRFVQIYGKPTTSDQSNDKPLTGRTSASPLQPPMPAARFPKVVVATFLFRDAITIFGSINLPPMLTSSIPDSLFSNPAIKMAAMQIFTPVLSQIVATPVHLLGLDLYSNPHSTRGERGSRLRRSLVPTTAMRCSRIIPAFGVGLVLNTGLRDYFKGKVGVAGHV